MDPADQAFPDGPPADPEEWTDDQWLDWLKATDEAGDEADGAETPPVTMIGRATRSSGGAVLGQAMLGLANAMYGEKENIVVVAEGDSAPEGDEPFALRLDPDHPERSTVVIRPAAEPPA